MLAADRIVSGQIQFIKKSRSICGAIKAMQHWCSQAMETEDWVVFNSVQLLGVTG